MKNFNYTNWVFCIALIFGVTACDDNEFLEEVPRSFYTLNNAISSQDQVDQLLINCYAKHRYFRNYTNNNDHCQLYGNGTDVLDVPVNRNDRNLSDYTQLNPDFGLFNFIYTHFYELSGDANTALWAAEREDISWSSDEDRNFAMAQARFWRAFAYKNLGQLFGGVALVDEVVTEPRFDFVRATRPQTYQFAIQDLELALDGLPETTAQGGRIVKGAAQHFLSELYLSLGVAMEDEGSEGITVATSSSNAFEQARDYASDVIDGGTYALMTERFGTRADEDGKDVFWDLFQRGNTMYSDGNMESIWVYVCDETAYGEGNLDEGAAVWHPRPFCDQRQNIGPDAGRGETVDPVIKNIVLQNGDARGIASFAPTSFIMWDAWADELFDDMRNSEANIQRTVYYNNPEYYGVDDISEVDVLESYPLDNWLLPLYDPMWPIDGSTTEAGRMYYYYSKVHTDDYIDVPGNRPNSRLFRDEYAIRLAETILLRAEAHWRLGDNGSAADDINLLRNRAQASYLATAGDIDLDFILDERARELFLEERRWNTLLRMGGTVAVDRIIAKNIWPSTNVQSTLVGREPFNAWPIPQQQIDRNKDVIWEQNPGW